VRKLPKISKLETRVIKRAKSYCTHTIGIVPLSELSARQHLGAQEGSPPSTASGGHAIYWGSLRGCRN